MMNYQLNGSGKWCVYIRWKSIGTRYHILKYTLLFRLEFCMLIYCIWWFYTYFRHLCAESLGVIFVSVFVECIINTLITLICVFKYCCTLFGFHKNTCSCFITFGRSVVMKSIETERWFAGLNHGYILSIMSVHLGQSSHICL